MDLSNHLDKIKFDKPCPACGHYIAALVLHERHPLANTVHPRSVEEAQNLNCWELQYVRCTECGHIYNYAFDYNQIPYSQQSYPLFNKGKLWTGFIEQIQKKLVAMLPECPTVVEIGHGDGSFLAGLQKLNPKGNYIGFDVSGARDGEGVVAFRTEFFDPEVHLSEIQPDLIVSRHVLEHLSNPLQFLQHLAFVSSSLDLVPLTYFEVPCADRVLETKRTVDFFYEHNSHFTTESFKKMLSKCHISMETVGYGCDREVIYNIGYLGVASRSQDLAWEALEYNASTVEGLATIEKQMHRLYESGKKVAIWGGLGRSVAFMNRYGVDRKRFPVVVDSDPSKVGVFVPGTGQQIQRKDWLLENPVDVVIIPSQWRAADIVAEMDRMGLAVETVSIEHDGQLMDYHRASHPYKKYYPGEQLA